MSIRAAPFGATPHAVEPHVLQVQEGVEVLARAIGGSARQELAEVSVLQFGCLVAEDAGDGGVHAEDVARRGDGEDAFLGVVEYGAQPGFTVGDLLVQGVGQGCRALVAPGPLPQQPPQEHRACRPAHEQHGGRGLKRSPVGGGGLPPSGQTEQQAASEHNPGAEVQPACFLFGSRDLDPHSVGSCLAHQLTFRERRASVCSSEETTSNAGLKQIDTRNKG